MQQIYPDRRFSIYYRDPRYIISYETIYEIFLRSRIVEHLLTNNANASKRDKKGFTAIHYASVKGNKLSIEMVSTPAVYLERYVKTRLRLQFQVHFYPCGRMRTSEIINKRTF